MPRRFDHAVRLCCLLPILVAGFAGQRACGDEAGGAAADSADRFLRLERRQDGVVTALQTAILHCAADTRPGVVVDLIGAVHVADQEYYTGLNDRFAGYEAVLYELVASADARPEPGSRSAHPLSLMQVGIKNLLDLHFQLDCIDYSAANFVHADLTPAEFSQSMSRRGESLPQMIFRLIGQSIAAQSQDPGRASDARLLAALFASDRGQLKRVVAEQFELAMGVPSILEGPGGSTIITDRNRRALDVLAQQLEAGRQRIAIFYGAAHLPDLERQLQDRFDFQPQRTSWLTAWKMP